MRKRLSTSIWKNKYDIQNRSVLNKVGTPITCWTQLGIQAKSFESLARYLQVQRCAQLKSKMPAEISGHFSYYLAERVGFEPTVPCGTPDFESGTFDHSATSPGRKRCGRFRKRRIVADSLWHLHATRPCDSDNQAFRTFNPPIYGHSASGTAMLPSAC